MTSEDQEANSKPTVLSVLPSPACGCFLRTKLYTLLGCQLAMLHMKLILKFSSISIVWYPANPLLYFIIQQMCLLRASYLSITVLDLGEPRLSRE